jgi:hypothetical protein
VLLLTGLPFCLSTPAAACPPAACAPPELGLPSACQVWHAACPQVMDLVELTPLRNTLVGLPGASGLSVEQRKRLTIAVELVRPYVPPLAGLHAIFAVMCGVMAQQGGDSKKGGDATLCTHWADSCMSVMQVSNPSIIFMDEPTSGAETHHSLPLRFYCCALCGTSAGEFPFTLLTRTTGIGRATMKPDLIRRRSGRSCCGYCHADSAQHRQHGAHGGVHHPPAVHRHLRGAPVKQWHVQSRPATDVSMHPAACI